MLQYSHGEGGQHEKRVNVCTYWCEGRDRAKQHFVAEDRSPVLRSDDVQVERRDSATRHALRVERGTRKRKQTERQNFSNECCSATTVLELFVEAPEVRRRRSDKTAVLFRQR